MPESTPTLTRERIASYGAQVVVHGAAWDDADVLARELSSKPGSVCVASLLLTDAAYIPPFDHADVWTGNASLVTELARQMGAQRPGAVVVSVGGGGLLCGLLQGMHQVTNSPLDTDEQIQSCIYHTYIT